MPKSADSASRAAGKLSPTEMCSGRVPRRSRPPMSARPMLPPPKNAICPLLMSDRLYRPFLIIAAAVAPDLLHLAAARRTALFQCEPRWLLREWPLRSHHSFPSTGYRAPLLQHSALRARGAWPRTTYAGAQDPLHPVGYT